MLALRALEGSPLGRQLGFELRPPAGVRTVVGCGTPAFDLSLEPASLLVRLVAGTDRCAVRRESLLASGLGFAHRGRGLFERSAGRLLGPDSRFALPNEPIPPVSLGQHTLLSSRRRLAQLTGRRRPDSAGARHRDPAKPRSDVLDRIYDPGVAQQHPGEREGLVG